MNLSLEGMSSEQRSERNRRDTLRWNISQLLVFKSDTLVTLKGREENGSLPIIRILGGSMKLPDNVRPSQVGLVDIGSRELSGGSTTVSIDQRQYRVDGFGARRIDELMEDSSEEEDVVQTMLDVVTPLWEGVTVTWTPLLSRMKAAEQIEVNPDLDWTANYET